MPSPRNLGEAKAAGRERCKCPAPELLSHLGTLPGQAHAKPKCLRQPSTNSSPSADPRHHPRALGNPLTYPSSLQNSSVRQVHVGFWSSWWHRSALRRGRSRERTVLDRGKQTREKFITCLRSLLASTGNRHRNLRKLQQKEKKKSIWSSPLPSAHPHVKECAVLGPPAPSPLTP